MRNAVSSRWFEAALVTVFAAVAFVLAVIGLYAVIAFLVAQRTHEIGVRVALGATRNDVLRLVLAQSGVLIAIGVAIGVTAAVPVGRLVASTLFEVQSFDLSVYVATTIAVLVISLAAVATPAVRATRVDPVIALRTE
jgi:ABC-type antimicrobial peptide transport system permease subunit